MRLSRGIAAIVLPAVAAMTVTCTTQKSNFSITGDIAGLQIGDTVKLCTLDLPSWNESTAFTIVVDDTSGFSCKGYLEHDQYFILRYKTNEGKEIVADRNGKTFIVRPGDDITFTGRRENIYYSRISGGIYDEPQLAGYLKADDSLGLVRGSYMRNLEEARAAGDTAEMYRWADEFNAFYNNNPGVDRVNALKRAYIDSNTQGTLFLLVERLPGIGYEPIDKVRKIYDNYSEEIKESWYGKKTAEFITRMEAIAPGRPAPDFELVTIDGDTITKETYAGKYLLFYHWGLCPGSIYIDSYVCGLYDKYHRKGLEVVGLTESIATIRDLYGQTLDSAHDSELNATLGNMLKHKWTEVELETEYPENKNISDTYMISGWPFFILIGPDGTILARNFSEAFYESQEILEKELGNPAHPKEPSPTPTALRRMAKT